MKIWTKLFEWAAKFNQNIENRFILLILTSLNMYLIYTYSCIDREILTWIDGSATPGLHKIHYQGSIQMKIFIADLHSNHHKYLESVSVNFWEGA